jgi:hypothetical protein
MEPIREVLFKPAWYWLITIIPTILTYIGIIPEDKRSGFVNQFYNLFPFWAWLTIALIAFATTILISANNYVKRKLNEQAKGNQPPSTSISQISGRDSYSSGRDTIINEPPKEKEPPNIFAGFLSQDHSLLERAVFRLCPLPPKPDFDELVKKERSRLLQKYEPDIKKQHGTEKALHDMFSITIENSLYAQWVEEYLPKYREYVEEVYNFSIITDRYRKMEIALQCRGMSPASLVILELYLPEDIHFPSSEIEWLRDEMIRMDGYPGGYKPHRPKPPDPFESRIHPYDAMMAPAYAYPIEAANVAPQIKGDYKISNRSGTNVIVYEVQDLIQNHLYTDLVPIPIWLDNFERSTVISVPIKIYSRDLANSPIEKTIEIELIVRDKPGN